MSSSRVCLVDIFLSRTTQMKETEHIKISLYLGHFMIHRVQWKCRLLPAVICVIHFMNHPTNHILNVIPDNVTFIKLWGSIKSVSLKDYILNINHWMYCPKHKHLSKLLLINGDIPFERSWNLSLVLFFLHFQGLKILPREENFPFPFSWDCELPTTTSQLAREDFSSPSAKSESQQEQFWMSWPLNNGKQPTGFYNRKYLCEWMFLTITTDIRAPLSNKNN